MNLISHGVKNSVNRISLGVWLEETLGAPHPSGQHPEGKGNESFPVGVQSRRLPLASDVQMGPLWSNSLRLPPMVSSIWSCWMVQLVQPEYQIAMSTIHAPGPTNSILSWLKSGPDR